MWRGLMAARREGLCDSIGVASFTQTHLEQLIARAPEVLPAVNQAEVHPRNANVDLVEFCQQKGIVVCAWSPLGLGAKMNLFEDPTLLAIAQRHGVSPAAVALRGPAREKHGSRRRRGSSRVATTPWLLVRVAATPWLLGRVAATPRLLGRVAATPRLLGRVSATPRLLGRVAATPWLPGRVAATPWLPRRVAATGSSEVTGAG